MRLDSALKSVKAKLPDRRGGSPQVTQLRVPGFLSETVRDLRDQGLLPVVVVLLIALPVAAIAFGGTSSSYDEPPAASAASGSDDSGESLVVVADRPGLRDPVDRFRGRSPRDPFRAVGPAGASGLLGAGGGGSSESGGSGGSGSGGAATGSGGGSGQGGSGSSDAGLDAPADSATDSSGSTATTGSSSDPAPPSSADGTTTTRVETRYVRTHVQARIRFGAAGSGELREVDDLPRLSGLPANQPIVTYLGASMRHDAALFSVSPDVAAIAGEGECPSGSALRCHYLLLRPGQALNIYDAARDVIWRLGMPALEVVESETDLIEEIIESRSADRRDGDSGDTDARDRPVSSD